MPSREQQIHQIERRYPIGAEVIRENQTHFRVWAPKARELDVVVERGPNSPRTFHSLTPEPGGYFSGIINAGAETLYRVRVNDGVNLFAPSHLYGTPDDLRAFIDRAHSLGLGVILDVVYNHFGPDGNYLAGFSDDYLIREKENEWGNAINFDGPNSGAVREFFITNGRYWIEEFHFDGFRFDATHAIRDRSREYIIGAVGRAAREAADPRSII